MQTYKVRLPAFLAPALINGDRSGLDDVGDEAILATILEYYAPASFVSCEGEPCWARVCYAAGQWFTGDVLEYTLLEES